MVIISPESSSVCEIIYVTIEYVRNIRITVLEVLINSIQIYGRSRNSDVLCGEVNVFVANIANV
jgi:hypothetical protein